MHNLLIKELIYDQFIHTWAYHTTDNSYPFINGWLLVSSYLFLAALTVLGVTYVLSTAKMFWLGLILGVPIVVLLMPKFLRALLHTCYADSGTSSFQNVNFNIVVDLLIFGFRIMVLFEIPHQSHLACVPTGETPKSSNLQYGIKEAFRIRPCGIWKGEILGSSQASKQCRSKLNNYPVFFIFIISRRFYSQTECSFTERMDLVPFWNFQSTGNWIGKLKRLCCSSWLMERLMNYLVSISFSNW